MNSENWIRNVSIWHCLGVENQYYRSKQIFKRDSLFSIFCVGWSTFGLLLGVMFEIESKIFHFVESSALTCNFHMETIKDKWKIAQEWNQFESPMLSPASDKNETNSNRWWSRDHYLISVVTLHISISCTHSTNKSLKVHLSMVYFLAMNQKVPWILRMATVSVHKIRKNDLVLTNVAISFSLWQAIPGYPCFTIVEILNSVRLLGPRVVSNHF